MAGEPEASDPRIEKQMRSDIERMREMDPGLPDHREAGFDDSEGPSHHLG